MIISFVAFSFNFWPNMIALLSAHAFNIVVAQSFVYGTAIPGVLVGLFASAIWLLFNSTFAHLMLTWGGKLFVKAEILREGNEELLNNLKEGVFIIAEDSGIVLFLNEAAKKFNIRLNCNFSMSQIGVIDVFD